MFSTCYLSLRNGTAPGVLPLSSTKNGSRLSLLIVLHFVANPVYVQVLVITSVYKMSDFQKCNGFDRFFPMIKPN